MVTKSDYLKYVQCPKLAWLNKYKPELIPQEVKDSFVAIMESGYEVESYAYKLFPEGQKAESEANTKELIKRGGIIFQPTIIIGELHCRADIIKFDETNQAWDIYEVKSSTQVKIIHEYDLSFQKVCFEKAGYQVGKTYLVHINSDYIRKGEINPQELFKIDDLTSKINALAKETESGIKKLSEIFFLTEEPKIRPVKQCKNPYECVFKKYCLRDLPERSIYSIIGKLSEKTINKLLDGGISKIEDIPNELIPTSFLKHFDAIKNDRIYIDQQGIKNELANIQYPIYYLDYETYGSVIPMFDGYKPYQNITFQYSLHVQESPQSELKHYAFLYNQFQDPTKELAESLKKIIGKTGTTVAWNMGFEKECNKAMGERFLEYKEFFEDINNRMYDLMMPFKKGLYIHKDFLGSASLKKVLPVLVPKLSYAELNIHEGMTASNRWREMVDDKTSKIRKNEIYNDLLKYCHLDTLAMVEIHNELKKLVKN